ncbi:pilin subunit UpsB [Sulfodiicoccus acidiphilus]|uniref:pilin subunit UpsB n=1 Tax=Sulfodiicoccus acidiphilus TaxID=1670455 RepID=UPI001668FA8E
MSRLGGRLIRHPKKSWPRAKRGLSSILSSLIVTAVTLSLAGALLGAFWGRVYNSESVLQQSDHLYDEQLQTRLEIVGFGNTTSSYYLFNYGASNVTVTQVAIGNRIVRGNWEIPPGTMVELSKLVGDRKVDGRLIVIANDLIFTSQT